MAEAQKTTIRWDPALKADAEAAARKRDISVAEFIRQSVVHYVAWCASREMHHPDDNGNEDNGGEREEAA